MKEPEKLIEDLKNGELIPENIVFEICDKVIEILIEESNIETISPPLTICGDLHGQFQDLLTLFEVSGTLEYDANQTKYLFLGDFVDRGFYSVETFLLLILYKLRYPTRIYLIRGNHESRSITSIYGFYDECFKKYGNVNVWKCCCDLFDYLSLGAYIEGGIFCIHGGLSPNLASIDDIKYLNRKLEIPNEGLICDLLWSDPDEDVNNWRISPRGAGYLFGKPQVEQFNHINGLNLIARAHQLIMEGYKELFDGNLVTVWSAPNYCYRCGNVASTLKINDDLSREYIIFETNMESNDLNFNGRMLSSHKNSINEYFL